MADAAVSEAPTVRRMLVVQRAAGAVLTPWTDGRDAWWHAPVPGEGDGPAPDDARATDPETPYMLIYTSGTTGRPKGAVHVHGGFPIKGAQDLAHQFDLGPGDTLFWFTDLGWMMGPWAISGALLRGARLVLYEGAPDHPGPDRLWSIVARHRVTHLGLSPTVIRALMAHGEAPVQAHDRSSLRVLGSTGEPWNPDPWWWYFRAVGGGRCPIINYSGGTEVSGGIVSGNVLGPIKPASFSGPCIGTAADVVDEAGRALRGAVGELVIRAPMPGMTRGFWRDEEGRYEATYWSRFPGVWLHGDWATIDGDGFWYIQGRSDDTLKIAGKRVGPAEVESAAVSHPAVLEAAAIGVPHEIKGEVVVVLVVLRPGESDDPGLRRAIAETVAGQLGKPLKPDRVAVVTALPKTRSGKVMRRAIRAAWLDLDPGDLSSLDDPHTLEAIRASALRTREDHEPRRERSRSVSESATTRRDIVTWDDLDRMVGELAERLRSESFDLMLAITRGGLVPAGMLAYRLRIRNILVAAVEFYDDHGQPGPHPTFLQFPADPLLRGQRILVVDEVWDSGTTIHAVTERIRQAGGHPDDRGPPLEANALGRARRARRSRRDHRRLGGLPVQGGRLESPPSPPYREWSRGARDDPSPAAGRHEERCVHPRERSGPARVVQPRPAVRGLADPRPDRRTRQRRDPGGGRQPMVRACRFPIRGRRNDLDPLLGRADLRR